MKISGHKRSISGYSQPSQSKYSQNSLLNTMIRVNKIGGVASNLDSSAVANGTRPSLSPYRKNSNNREATPKTAVSRNGPQTAKSNLENLNTNASGVLNNRNNNKLSNSLNTNNFNFGNNDAVIKVASKTPPPTQPKRLQSSNNFVLRNNGLLNSVAGLNGSQRGNNNNDSHKLMSSFANNSQSGFGYNKISNSARVDSNSKSNNSSSVKNLSSNKDRNNNSRINSLSSSGYNLSSGRNFFSKLSNNNTIDVYNKNINIRNIASSKQIQTNQQRNLLGGLLESSLAASGHRSNRANNNNNNSKNIMNHNTRITIKNENLSQRKFEKNLNNAKTKNSNNKINNNNNSDYSNNTPLNHSLEKSSTSSFNSAYDKIRVNRSNLLLQQQKSKLNTINNNSNNTSNNNNNSNNNSSSNNDVLSSLLNSKNKSKSPKLKSSSPALQKNSSLFNDLNNSPNNLNILGKSGFNPSAGLINNNFSGLTSSNDLSSKIYSLNSQSRKNLELTQKQYRDKSKSPSASPAPISASLNNLNILNNLKMNKNLLAKNAKNFTNVSLNNNNLSLKKLNLLNSGNGSNVNSQTIQVNRIKNNNLSGSLNIDANIKNNKNNEVRGTIMEMNSEEFMSKLTGKFGGVTKESFYNAGKKKNNGDAGSRSNSNNISQNNSNNNFKKEENNINISANSKVNNHTGMSFGKYNDNNNENNNNDYNCEGSNLFSFNKDSRENKFMNSNNNNNNNLNNSSKPNSNQAATNKGSGSIGENMNNDILNNLNIKQMQTPNSIIVNSFKEMNTSPFLKNKSNASERNLILNRNANLPNTSSNNHTKSIGNLISKVNPDSNKTGESRNSTSNPAKTSSKLSNSNLNEYRSIKDSPFKTNKIVDNIIVPPKKFRKRILYMSEITKVGFSGQSNKKHNQDNFFIYKNFNNDPNAIYMSVCDGHGVHGHEVSGYLKENLPANLSKNFIKKNISLSNTSASDSNFQGLIKETFINTNDQMTFDLRVDTNFSGSTCVSLIYTPTKLTAINVGDSRAVLGRLVNGVWKSHDLSNDHKPSEAIEAARIKKAGGRIEPYTDENNEFIGPPRVWLKEEDIPGLAMTRSFGDKIANIVGVTCEPEITEWELTPEDKFIIIASDGVWEFIESEECVNILKEFYIKSDHKGACEYIVKESSKRWMKVIYFL